MKKNKKIWSYALACALAMSNLSVVAAPFTSIVAQAQVTNPTEISGTLTANQGDTVSAKVEYNTDDASTDSLPEAPVWDILKGSTSVKGTAADKISLTSVPANAWDPTTGNGTAVFACTVKVGPEVTPGSYTIKAGNLAAEFVVKEATTTYALHLDGAQASDVIQGKDYNLQVIATKFGVDADVTDSTVISVTSDGNGEATFSNGTLSIANDATVGAKVYVSYTPQGETKTTKIPLTIKAGTNAKEFPSIKVVPSADIKLYADDSTGVDTYVNVDANVEVPEGYTKGGITYAASLVSGVGLTVKSPVGNVINVTTDGLSVSKKTSYVVKYIATMELTKSGSDKIVYRSETTREVTVLPSPAYKLTVTGDNYDKDDDTYTLKEKDGSIILTASVDPDGTDIEELEDVKYTWKATSSNIVTKSNGASVEITAKTPFTATSSAPETVTLDITDKDGNPINDKTGTPISTKTYNIVLVSDYNPSIEASSTDVLVGDEVEFTVYDAEGKEVKDLAGYTIKDGSSTITLTSGKYKFTTAGSHKITVTDTKRSLTSDVITVNVRSEDGIQVTDLILSKDNVKLAAKDATDTVNATVIPDGTGTDKEKAEINTVTVKSNDEDVATVTVATPSSANVSVVTIKAVAPGETTITVTTDDGNIEKEISVVVAGYKGIVIDSDEDEVEVGKTITINADVQVYGDDFSKDINWISSDASVATVKDGVVTGVKEGTAKIYATAKNDSTKKSNELEITVVDNTIPNAIKAAEAAAAAAVANPTDATIKAAQDAIAAAKKAGATDADLKAATDNLTKAEAAKKAADEKQKEEEQKKSDGSAAGTPAPVGNELKDAAGNATGFVVTNATSGAAEAEYKGLEADKSAKKVTIPNEVKDQNGNVYKVTSIAANALKNAKGKEIVINKNIKKIGKNAMKGAKFTKITLKTDKKGKVSIGKNAFKTSKKATIKIKGCKGENKDKLVKKVKKQANKKSVVK